MIVRGGGLLKVSNEKYYMLQIIIGVFCARMGCAVQKFTEIACTKS